MSLDKLMEGWRNFLKEDAKVALYTGAVVQDVENLNSKLDELGLRVEGWKDSSVGSHGNEQLNHHMTIVPSPANKSKTPIELNVPTKLKIVAFGVDEKLGIAAWKVDTDMYVQSGVPHITAMLRDETVKPFLAAKIKDWKSIEPFTVDATVEEVFSK
jgi:hypothetical protein